jgi:hypothetical protein
MTRNSDLTTRLSLTVSTIVIAIYGVLFIANSLGLSLIG